MTRKKSADPVEALQDEPEVDEREGEIISPAAAPDPVSTPGLPVAAIASPARTAPIPISVPLAPVQSWLVPATGP